MVFHTPPFLLLAGQQVLLALFDAASTSKIRTTELSQTDVHTFVFAAPLAVCARLRLAGGTKSCSSILGSRAGGGEFKQHSSSAASERCQLQRRAHLRICCAFGCLCVLALGRRCRILQHYFGITCWRRRIQTTFFLCCFRAVPATKSSSSESVLKISSPLGQ